jgi:hypothetical protein
MATRLLSFVDKGSKETATRDSRREHNHIKQAIAVQMQINKKPISMGSIQTITIITPSL